MNWRFDAGQRFIFPKEQGRLMRILTAGCIVFISSLCLASGAGLADDVPAADGPKLLEQGDKLADAGQFTEAVIRYKSAMEKLLPTLRKTPVQA